MEMNIAFLGSIASIFAVLLAFYTIFINGRAIRKMLKEHGEILKEHGKFLKNMGKFLKEWIKPLKKWIKILKG